jgi:hypothetical protein
MRTCTALSIGLSGLVVLAASTSARAAAPATGDVKQWVDQKVADCEPKPEERRFDETGWVTDIRSALKLAREHHRPVFLFTHDGHMAVGRC